MLRLAGSELDDATIERLLTHAADRVMSALATRARIRFDPPRAGELFCRWPIAVRAGFDIVLPDAPLWTGDCPRCDRTLDVAHDSYGLPTYTRLYRCTTCGWRDEQPTGEETMATMYSRMHEQDAAARVARIVAQPVDGECWPLHGLPFEDGDPLPALAAIKYRSVSDVQLRNGSSITSRSPQKHFSPTVPSCCRRRRFAGSRCSTPEHISPRFCRHRGSTAWLDSRSSSKTTARSFSMP